MVTSYENCTVCEGYGYYNIVVSDIPLLYADTTCKACKGKGFILRSIDTIIDGQILSGFSARSSRIGKLSDSLKREGYRLRSV